MLIIDIFQAYVDDKVTSNKNMEEILKDFNDDSFNLMKVITQCSYQCGCINPPNDIEYDMKNIDYDKLLNLYVNTSCDNCRKKIEHEIAKCLVTLTSICSLCGINIADIFIKEHRNIEQHYSAI